MNIHRPHCYDPKNRPEIIRIWKEDRQTKNPFLNSTVEEKNYTGTFVEYYYVNKNKKRIHVPELCLLVEWKK